MEFSYSTYRNTLFALPVAITAVMLIHLGLASYRYWKKTAGKKKLLQNTLEYIVCLCILGCCVVPQCKSLINGGIFLLCENESDTIIYSGTIESIREPSELFSGFKLSHQYGADFIIDGERYFAISSGDYSEGDFVTIHYLPLSHFILYIYESTPIN